MLRSIIHRWAIPAIGVAAVVLAACGGVGPEGVVAIAKDNGGLSDPEGRTNKAPFGCDPTSAGVDPMPEPPPDPGHAEEEPAAAGQMTEEAGMAKRLFDAERWPEAAVVLGRVVNSETGDDAGNRQIAEYLLAISNYRLKKHKESLALFTAIAGRKDHLKFNETLPWLAKLADLGPPYTDSAGRVMAMRYASSGVQYLDNPQRRSLGGQILQLIGRQLYRAGQYDKAMATLEKVPPESEYHELARECIALARRRAAR